MKFYRMLRRAAVVLATGGLLMPVNLVQAATQPQVTRQTNVTSTVTSDVALQAGGVLHGQVVDGQGAALARVPVAIESQGRKVATVTTDDQGYFRIAGLRGGSYVVSTAHYLGTHRLWAAHTAPPVATNGLLVVASSDAELGQGILTSYGVGGLVVLGGIGAIVAIAVSDHDAS